MSFNLKVRFKEDEKTVIFPIEEIKRVKTGYMYFFIRNNQLLNIGSGVAELVVEEEYDSGFGR